MIPKRQPHMGPVPLVGNREAMAQAQQAQQIQHLALAIYVQMVASAFEAQLWPGTKGPDKAAVKKLAAAARAAAEAFFEQDQP